MVVRALASTSSDAFVSLIFEIFETASRISYGRDARPAAASFRVQRVKRYIEDHVTDALTLDDMATIVNLSPFVLIRQFKEAEGMTPYAYLSRCRAFAAQALLRNTNGPIEEVGRRVGFDDPNYFARFFKRATGVTPSQYREHWIQRPGPMRVNSAMKFACHVAPPSSEY